MQVNFDKALYKTGAVKAAIKEYKGLADFSCKENKCCTVVKISKIKDSKLKPFFKEEFSNYVLALTGLEK